MLKFNAQYQTEFALRVPEAFGLRWEELVEAGAPACGEGLPKLETEEDQLLYGRALAYVLANHLGKLEQT